MPIRLGLLIDGVRPDAASIEIAGVTADSRAVRPGYLFAALKGAKADGSRFIPDAVRAGAVAVLIEVPHSAHSRESGNPAALAGTGSLLSQGRAVEVVEVVDSHRALALAASRFYPRQPKHLVAVTGTSGKTSVSVFTRQIFEAAGHLAASLGTIGLVTARRTVTGGLTTPDPVKLHQTLAELAADGIDHVAMEASSHGLEQKRLDGLRLVAAGFTNLGRDHLDYHPSVRAYLDAKLRLFSAILPPEGTAVINADSDVAAEVIAAAKARGSKVMTVGVSGNDIRIESAEPAGLSQRLVLEARGRRHDFLLPLAGTFQAENVVMAAGLAIAAGLPADTAIAALAVLKGAQGRLEKVAETAEGAAIFVDYAHKPEAIRAALSALRPMTRGRLIAVIGAGGDRDAGKRPLMGAAATAFADLVIVTDDNPRSEDPASIRRAILQAAPNAIEIAGRGRAIGEAIAMLRDGDVLCIAGKGHETGQIVGDKVLPFSDHEAVAAALREVAQ